MISERGGEYMMECREGSVIEMRPHIVIYVIVLFRPIDYYLKRMLTIQGGSVDDGVCLGVPDPHLLCANFPRLVHYNRAHKGT